MKNYYEEIKKYFAEFWTYVNEDSLSYLTKETHRLEKLVEKAKREKLEEPMQQTNHR